MFLKRLWCPILFLLSMICAADVNLPPFVVYSARNEVTETSGHLRILGPLFETYEKNNASVAAFRPFWSTKTEGEISGTDALWPLFTQRSLPSGNFWWLLPYFHYSAKEGTAYENLLAPFLYLGRHRDGSLSWFVFPVAGDTREFLSLGQNQFVLWPLYWHNRKNGLESTGILWPLFNRAWGNGVEKIRFFPVYASNRIEEVRLTRSWLWPLLTTAESLRKDQDGFAVFSFPLGGYEDWGPLKNRSVLWPFFTWQSKDDGSFVLNAPWPFFRYGTGSREESVLFFWPFWGYTDSKDSNYAFFLWPCGLYLFSQTPESSERWLCMLPVYWSRKEYGKEPERVPEKRFRHVWPLFSVQDDYAQKTSTIRGLDLIPFKRPGVLERNYNPFWTLFQVTNTEKGMSFDILWGLFRCMDAEQTSGFAIGPFYLQETDNGTGAFECEALFGLVKVRSEREKSSCRLFYLLDF